ncbi:MAG: hypothetical protein MUD17_14320 [Gemmatimonadaceae bacterium]|jgi:hypothetical protein|nr:hypothetical protein [Gemmatimonadaceae bacterium]
MTASLRTVCRAVAALLSGSLLAAPLLAQDPLALPDEGAPRTGLQLAIQLGLPFTTYRETPVVEGQEYTTVRGRSAFHVRASYHVLGATSVWLEGGQSERGSGVQLNGENAFDIRVNRWELLTGANVALRCLGPVCPSVDIGAGAARRREATLREPGSRRIVGTTDVALTEISAIAGVRLAARRWPQFALVLRHEEGLTDLRPDLANATVKSRSQYLGVSLLLGGR